MVNQSSRYLNLIDMQPEKKSYTDHPMLAQVDNTKESISSNLVDQNAKLL